MGLWLRLEAVPCDSVWVGGVGPTWEINVVFLLLHGLHFCVREKDALFLSRLNVSGPRFGG